MPQPDKRPHAERDRFAAARLEARSAAFKLARESGAQLETRPLFHGAETSVQDIEPLAGARAARELELGARSAAHTYIRFAREAGHSWQQIGHELGLVPGGERDMVGESVAEAAYTYAAGSPDTETARRYGRSFLWTCGSCEGTIIDRGLVQGPAEDEQGHAENCSRLAKAVATWDAEWEAEP